MVIHEKIDNIFDFLPETNLIEEDFYSHRGDYPVYSGQTDGQGIIGAIDSYNQEMPCITFTTYGVGAGKIFYREGKFTIGRNCMGLRPKKKYQNKLNLKWFAHSFQNLFYRLRIGDPQGQRSLNKLLLQRVLIEIPHSDIQDNQLGKYASLLNLKKKINVVQNELKSIIIFQKIYPSDSIIAKDKIELIVNIIGGNSGLTEEFIYHNLPDRDEDKIEILTGATLERTAMGFISKNAKPNNRNLKIFIAPAILVVRKGIAGKMTYIPKGRFTTNDDAYVLTSKREWKDKINLEWFTDNYQELFYKIVTSKSDNATFSKEYAERQIIQLPHINDQNRIVSKLTPLKTLINELQIIEKKIDDLLEYTII
jgi:restriction endonuclease S subunit